MKHFHYFGGYKYWRGIVTKKWIKDINYYLPEDHPYFPGSLNEDAYARVYECRCGLRRQKVNPYPSLWAWGY